MLRTILFNYIAAFARYCRLPRSCCGASLQAHREYLLFQSAAPACYLFLVDCCESSRTTCKPHRLITWRRIGPPLRRMARRNSATPAALVIAFAAAPLLVASGAFAKSCALGCPHNFSPLRSGSAADPQARRLLTHDLSYASWGTACGLRDPFAYDSCT